MTSRRLTYLANTVKFSPIDDSLLAVTAYEPNELRGRLNTYNSMMCPISSLGSQFYELYDCTWSSTNSNLIIIATNRGSSHLIDFSRDDNHFRQSFLRHNSSNTTSVAWHPNGESFLSASSDGTVNHWFIGQPIPKRTYNHPNAVSCVRWNARNPTFYASTCVDRILRIWDIRNENAVITIEADDSPLISCDWNWHGKACIATASYHRNYIKVWDIIQSNIPIKVLDGAHTAGVRRVKFSPHREYEIASSSADHRVALWDYGPEDADPRITKYEHHAASPLGLDMSRRVEGQLASCGRDGLVHVWQHALPEA